MTRLLKAGRYELALDRPLVMGIVNVTPDSFAGGIRDLDAAHDHARTLVDEGADILDIGGESTRPGAVDVDDDEEIARVVPLIERLADCRRPLSIDTRKATVMGRAVARTTKLPSLRGELATNSDTSSTNLNEGLDAALSKRFSGVAQKNVAEVNPQNQSR